MVTTARIDYDHYSDKEYYRELAWFNVITRNPSLNAEHERMCDIFEKEGRFDNWDAATEYLFEKYEVMFCEEKVITIDDEDNWFFVIEIEVKWNDLKIEES